MWPPLTKLSSHDHLWWKYQTNSLPFFFEGLYLQKIKTLKAKKIKSFMEEEIPSNSLRGSAPFLYFFLLLNLEAWNLVCLCKIEIP